MATIQRPVDVSVSVPLNQSQTNAARTWAAGLALAKLDTELGTPAAKAAHITSLSVSWNDDGTATLAVNARIGGTWTPEP